VFEACENQCAPLPMSETTKPKAISVPTTCAGSSVVRLSNAAEPSAPAPAAPKAKGKAAPNGATTGQPRSAEKRAFTDSELVALLTAEDTSPLLKDGMRCALLTGTRIEELFSIRVGDLRLTEAIPYIDLKGSKTEAARRTIPIHPDA